MNFKTFWNKAKDPVLYVSLGVLIALGVKNCSDNDKAGDAARDTDSAVRAAIEKIDSGRVENRQNADTLKDFAEATKEIVKRTDRKVDDLQETADTILAHVDSCCDCGCDKKPAPKPRPRKPVKRPCVLDTVVVHDTIYKECGQNNVVRGKVTCTEVRGEEYYRIYGGR